MNNLKWRGALAGTLGAAVMSVGLVLGSAAAQAQGTSPAPYPQPWGELSIHSLHNGSEGPEAYSGVVFKLIMLKEIDPADVDVSGYSEYVKDPAKAVAAFPGGKAVTLPATNSLGVVELKDQKLGLYLLQYVSGAPADVRYNDMVFTLPTSDGGKVGYKLALYPKIPVKPTPTPTPTPTEEPKGTQTGDQLFDSNTGLVGFGVIALLGAGFIVWTRFGRREQGAHR